MVLRYLITFHSLMSCLPFSIWKPPFGEKHPWDDKFIPATHVMMLFLGPPQMSK